MTESAFTYDKTGIVQSFFCIYTGQPVPEGLSLCLCGEVIETSEDPCPLYRVDPATGKHRLATPDDIEAAQVATDRGRLENEIVDLRIRADAAAAEGFTDLAGTLQAEIAARREGLQALEK